jgi:hypothetical protein
MIISVLAELNTIVTDQCATLIVTLLCNFNRAFIFSGILLIEECQLLDEPIHVSVAKYYTLFDLLVDINLVYEYRAENCVIPGRM